MFETEISTSASGLTRTESLKSASNSAVRSPDCHVAVTNDPRKSFPASRVLALAAPQTESRKDNKAAKTASHVCAGRLALATKMNPEQGTRSGFTTRCCLNS